MERKLVLIYWMMNILQSLMSLIQSQIHQPVINFQHRLRKMCGSFPSIEKSLSQLKALLMNSISTKLLVENPRSRSVYSERRATRGKILKIFVPDLINSDLQFHILNFSPREKSHPKEHWASSIFWRSVLGHGSQLWPIQELLRYHLSTYLLI